MIKRERVDLAILLLVSLLLSIYLFSRTYVISLDGAFQYIPMAKDFASGLFKEGFQKTGQQPLYPLLISGVSCWTKDFELAGMLVSSFFGILIILPVYYLGKRVFGQQVAFISVLLLIIHPHIRRFSADVLKESTYLFFLATAIWFSWRTIDKDKIYYYLLIPFLSTIAYLTRPDGIEVFFVVFFYVLLVKKFSRPTKRGKVILLLLLASGIFIFPYLLYLREITGEWTLSKTKSIEGLLGLEGIREGASFFMNRVFYTLKKLNLEFIAIYHPLYILLFFIGLWKKRASLFKGGEGFILSYFFLHYLISFLFILNLTVWRADETSHGFLFSGRHILPLILFSIYWVGEGFVEVSYRVLRKMESLRLFSHLNSERRSVLIGAIVLILMLTPILPKTLKPQRYERLPEKWAGVWIKSQSGKGTTLFTTQPRVAYYAEGNLEYIDFQKDNLNKIKSSMAEKNALYLVIRGREAVFLSGRGHPIEKGFIEVMRFEKKGMEGIVIYKFVL